MVDGGGDGGGGQGLRDQRSQRGQRGQRAGEACPVASVKHSTKNSTPPNRAASMGARGERARASKGVGGGAASPHTGGCTLSPWVGLTTTVPDDGSCIEGEKKKNRTDRGTPVSTANHKSVLSQHNIPSPFSIPSSKYIYLYIYWYCWCLTTERSDSAITRKHCLMRHTVA